jgi:hypothetical protein
MLHGTLLHPLYWTYICILFSIQILKPIVIYKYEQIHIVYFSCNPGDTKKGDKSTVEAVSF